MTLEKLEVRQQKELADCLRGREKRLADLEKDQKELISLCMIAGPKAHGMVKDLLHEQRQAWEAMEQEELDMLKHIHTLERENLLEKEAMRNELAVELSNKKGRDKDRGR